MSARAPVPRRTRRGEVLVGASLGARYLPAALVGLPIVSLVLSPLGAAAVQQWVLRPAVRIRLGGAVHAADTLGVQLLVAFCLLWALLALWALLPIVLSQRVVLLDPERAILSRRRGLRRLPDRPVADVVWAVGEADRDAVALIGLLPGGARADDDREAEQWVVPHIGWDDASFDGLRALQEAAGLSVSPPRPVLAAAARRRRRTAAHRVLAERYDIPWRPEYEDPAVFECELDHVRRVLGGKEGPRPEDPPPRDPGWPGTRG